MFGTGTKKMLNVMILKILENYSDENHRLTQNRIIELLDSEYGMKCDRRSVKKNIMSLKEMDYEITTKGGAFIERDFEEAELRMLIDSVLFSKNISRSQARRLIDKLRRLGNKYFDAKVKHVVNLPELQHSDNTQVMLVLDIVNEAINRQRKISFVYNRYNINLKLQPRRTEPYIVSPYQIAATNGKYYLICNYDKYNDVSHYRIDRMTDVKILKEKVKPKTKVFANGFNLPQHMAEHIYMFSGESIRVKFLTSELMIDSLVDWFGKDFNILQQIVDESTNTKKLLISVKVNAEAMKYWAMQYGENVEIVEPLSLRETICKTAEKIFKAHSN